MSDDETVLGKRPRNGLEQADEPPESASAGVEGQDDSDDDVGPMPIPAGTGESGSIKKKRKGE